VGWSEETETTFSSSLSPPDPILFSPTSTNTPSSIPTASPSTFGTPLVSPPQNSIYPPVPLPPTPTPGFFAPQPTSPTPSAGNYFASQFTSPLQNQTGAPTAGRTTPPSPVIHYHVASMSSSDTAKTQQPRSDVSDDAIERMRRWLSQQIIQPLAAVINEVDNSLESEGLNHLTTRTAFLPYPAMDLLAVVDLSKGGLKQLAPNAPQPAPQPASTGLFGARPSTGFSFGAAQPQQTAQKPQTLGNLLYSRPHDPIVRKRLLLELYLTLPPVADVYSRYPRDYIVQRVRELSVGGMLSAYRWDAGGTFAGEEWSRSRPTDAEVSNREVLFICNR